MSTETIPIHARDVSGQRAADMPAAPKDYTIGEILPVFRGEMDLPENDAEGRKLNYHGMLEREGRHLHSSELVGDALQAGDEIVLHPNIDAGLRQ